LRLSNADATLLAPHFFNSSQVEESVGASHSCHFNPTKPDLIAIANEISGISLIDIRMTSNILLRYKSNNSICVRFNEIGSELLALRRGVSKSKLISIYLTNDIEAKCHFESDSFTNSCTIKSCCFAGDRDQYIVCGSDDFCVYIWKKPHLSEDDYNVKIKSDYHLKLEGHRSIVNQCRFNKQFNLLATSGIEKVVKIWSPYQLSSGGGLTGHSSEYEKKRQIFKCYDLFNSRNEPNNNDPYDQAILNYEPVITNRFNIETEESTEEDKVVLAFFDSQLRRQRDSKMNYDSQFDDEDVEIPNMNEITSSSSSSSDADLDEYGNSVLVVKKKSNNLRNRLRNLRHRKSLNLTQSSEFIQVLDSLKVIKKDSSDNTDDDDDDKTNFNKPSSSSNVSISFNSSIGKESKLQDSNYLNFIKRLNEHKRKIEMNKEEEENDNNKNEDTDTETIDHKENEKILFKKKKRKYRSSN
jgi:hypothetical protein